MWKLQKNEVGDVIFLNLGGFLGKRWRVFIYFEKLMKYCKFFRNILINFSDISNDFLSNFKLFFQRFQVFLTLFQKCLQYFQQFQFFFLFFLMEFIVMSQTINRILNCHLELILRHFEQLSKKMLIVFFLYFMKFLAYLIQKFSTFV